MFKTELKLSDLFRPPQNSIQFYILFFVALLCFGNAFRFCANKEIKAIESHNRPVFAFLFIAVCCCFISAVCALTCFLCWCVYTHISRQSFLFNWNRCTAIVLMERVNMKLMGSIWCRESSNKSNKVNKNFVFNSLCNCCVFCKFPIGNYRTSCWSGEQVSVCIGWNVFPSSVKTNEGRWNRLNKTYRGPGKCF